MHLEILQPRPTIDTVYLIPGLRKALAPTLCGQDDYPWAEIIVLTAAWAWLDARQRGVSR